MCMDMKNPPPRMGGGQRIYSYICISDNLNVCNSQFCTSDKRSNNILTKTCQIVAYLHNDFRVCV